MHSFVGPHLSRIASEIGENYNSGMALNAIPASGPRYLFFNELSLQHSGTLHLNQSNKSKQSSVPTEIMNLITDLYESSGTTGNAPAEETVLKTLNDYWIVKRSVNWRHFFVIINKSSTLLEVTEEAKRMYDEHAKNVFFNK